MFAPRVAKPKAMQRQPSTVVAQRPSQSAVSQAHILQRSIGNQAMLRLLAQRGTSIRNERAAHESEDRFENPPPFSAPGLSGPIQAKLKIGAVDDPLEREADRAADHVTRMHGPKDPIVVAPPQISRKCVDCQEEETLQKKPARTQIAAGEAPAIVQEALRSPGQMLDAATLAYFEPRFEHDFSRVRVHTDQAAADAARDLSAQAFTVGEHILFGEGQYAPDGAAGRRLIAHELAHVMQQAGGNSASSSTGGVLQRSPEEPKQTDRQKWLEELGRNPQDAHNAWKKLSGPEGAMVLSLMAQRFGWPFAQQFLAEVKKGGPPPGESFYGRGTVTAEQLMARGYRLGGYFKTGAADIDVEVWFHPSGKMVRRDVSGRKEAPHTPIEECGPMVQVILDTLHDSITRETQVEQDLIADKERLEKSNKTSDDYSAQYDDYVGSLKAMKDRLEDTIDYIETLEQQLVEMNCPAPTIDDQELRDLQIWVDIESSPMMLQFLQPIPAQFKTLRGG